MVHSVARIILFSILLIFVACSFQPRPIVPINRANLNKVVYIDNSFEEWQEIAIINALHEWQCSTNHMVQYTIAHISDQSEVDFIDNVEHSIIIRGVSYTNEKIVNSDRKNKPGYFTMGLYTTNENGIPMILMVNDRLNRSTFKPAVLHELGHNLGLDHEKSEDSIMYFLVNYVEDLTDIDLKDFCQLYKCDSTKLKTCK